MAKIKIKRPWRDTECTKCKLCEDAQSVCLMGQGPKPCNVMIVGEAPGFREEDLDRPFQGKAGEVLESTLKKAGISREDAYITNAVKCRPPGNRKPTKPEIRSCKEYLDREIKKVNPQYVLLLGSTALQSVLGETGVLQKRGQVIERDGVKYFICLHPALLFRQPNLRTQFEADIQKFANLVSGVVEEDVDKTNWSLITTREALSDAIKWLQSHSEVSYDIESTSADSITKPGSKIYLIGFGDDTKQWVLPLDYPGGPFQKKAIRVKIMSILKDCFGNLTELIAQNGKFDNKGIKHHYDWSPKMTFDTMLAGHLVDENTFHGLEYMSRVYLGATGWKFDWSSFNPHTFPLKKLAKYNATDILNTHRLSKFLKKQLAKDKRLETINRELMVPASLMAEDLEREGVYVHQKRYLEAMLKITEEVDQLLVKLNRYAPKRELPAGMNPNTKRAQRLMEFNWNSTQQLAQFLFVDCGIEPLEKTGTGNNSTNESVLLRLQDEHKCIPILLKYRERLKIKQFLESWGSHADDRGYMHPRIMLGRIPNEDDSESGTVTGRLSYKDPNLQQTPRDTFIRSLIDVEDEEEWVLFESDYSQAELRLVAMASGDPTMLTAYQTGQDLHTLTASRILGIPLEQVSGPDRKKAKAINFGYIYGMGWKKFREYARDKYGVHLSETESKAFRDAFFDLYASLPDWHERQKRIVRKWKYVRTPMGRVRHLPEVDSPEQGIRAQAERQAINSPIQGMASDMTLFSGIRVHRELPRSEIRVVAFIHDAILGAVRKSCMDRLYDLKSVMEDTETIDKTFGSKITVPFVAEVKYGPWGLGKKLE